MSCNKKHIAFIHKDFPFGGAEKATYDVANFLCNQGYDVTLLVARHHLQLYPKNANPLFSFRLLPDENIKSSRKVAKAVRDFVNRRRVDVLVTYRELLYANWLKKKTSVKIVYELHSSPYYECLDIAEKKRDNHFKKIFYSCGVESLLNWFYRQKYRRIYRWADAYGVLCESYKNRIVEELKLSETGNKVWVLPNSTQVVGEIKWQKHKTIVYVGRLSHRDKRVDRLLRIWQKAQQQLGEWQLKIVGDGEEKDSLQHLARQLKLERITFTGHTNNVKNYYDEATALCLTSSFEGWPMSVAEAQANAIIPIVFDSFLGAKEMISTPDEGLLITPFDEDEYARELVGLLLDGERLKRMQRHVVKKAEGYTMERTGKVWIQMLTHILNDDQ